MSSRMSVSSRPLSTLDPADPTPAGLPAATRAFGCGAGAPPHPAAAPSPAPRNPIAAPMSVERPVVTSGVTQLLCPKTAIFSGGGGKLGAAVAHPFARESAAVYLTSHTGEPLERVANHDATAPVPLRGARGGRAAARAGAPLRVARRVAAAPDPCEPPTGRGEAAAPAGRPRRPRRSNATGCARPAPPPPARGIWWPPGGPRPPAAAGGRR